MDVTPIDDLVSELEEADPADAPDVADAIASSLGDLLDADDGETSAPPA